MNTTRAWCLMAAMASFALGSSPAEVHPFTLRVLAASDLRVEPRLSPDRSSLTLAVRLQDDRAAPLARRTVTLEIASAGAGLERATLTLGPNGEATHTVAITRDQQRVDVTAYYAGDGATAPRNATIHVNLDAPYVTVDLVAPAEGIALGGASAPFAVTLHVGEVVTFPVRGQGVELREGERVIASGVTGISGRVVLPVSPSALGAAGVHRLRAVTSVQGELVEGPEHAVLVRAETALSLVRVGSDDDSAGVRLQGTLLAVSGAPVSDAPVRVARGAITLAGVRTDAQGRFQVRVEPEVLAERGVTVRALFEPTEPWFGPSESAQVELTSAPPPKIHWLWVVAPAALAALGVAVVLVRARGQAKAEEAAKPDAASTQWDVVEHVAPSVTGGLRVRFVVVDRATTKAIAEPAVRWGADTEWKPVTAESVPVQAARKVEFELGASGYAPRRVTGEFSRPGEYVVKVQLRSWREELFERARPWLRRAGTSTGALPTLREALKTRAATPRALAFVELVEAGCYAPENPDAKSVERAEELSSVVESPAPRLGIEPQRGINV
jgi:hypothetical protein